MIKYPRKLCAFLWVKISGSITFRCTSWSAFISKTTSCCLIRVLSRSPLRSAKVSTFLCTIMSKLTNSGNSRTPDWSSSHSSKSSSTCCPDKHTCERHSKRLDYNTAIMIINFHVLQCTQNTYIPVFPANLRKVVLKCEIGPQALQN